MNKFRFIKWFSLSSVLILTACAPDYMARKLTGRECNAGYIAAGNDWCMPATRSPPPQPYCTQSWNGTDCWARPDLMPNVAHEVYEGPRGLTQEQNAKRLNLPVDSVPPTSQFFPP